LNISDAIPQCIGFYQQTSDQSSASSIEHHADESVQPESRLQVMKCSLLFELRPGVNGYNGTAHGGIVAALIDEAMGNLLVLNTELQLQQKKNGTALPAYVLDLDKVLTIFTARMDMRLKRPIATPQVVIVKAIIKVIEGRKIHFIVTVEGQGEVEYASCESTWVLIRKTKL
jgi:acyl-coenzyme A thioesterase PaaI-like protein